MWFVFFGFLVFIFVSFVKVLVIFDLIVLIFDVNFDPHCFCFFTKLIYFFNLTIQLNIYIYIYIVF
jgi:hypothetical protein